MFVTARTRSREINLQRQLKKTVLEELSMRAMQRKIQEYADAGKLRVCRWVGWGQSGQTSYFDDNGEIKKCSGYLNGRDFIMSWSKKYTHYTENLGDKIKIKLMLNNVPELDDFRHFLFPKYEEYISLDIIMDKSHVTEKKY